MPPERRKPARLRPDRGQAGGYMGSLPTEEAFMGSLRGPNFRIVLFWVRDEREGPIAVKDRRLGTDRRRSRQRTVFVSDVSYATVYLVRNALAGIERATCSTERLAVRTASCGSRRERFAARRVGEHVSSDVSLCTSYQS